MAGKRAGKSLVGLAVMGLVVFGALGLVFIRGQDHANAKHAEAPLIRKAYKNDSCEGTELWFSPVRGTVLILCGLPATNQWGGIIIRFTENMGQTILLEEGYECSVFASNRKYWNGVIKRDKYFQLANYPSIERAFRGWYQ